MWQAIQDWGTYTLLISAIISVAGIVGVLLMILWMPEDHFVQKEALQATPPSSLRMAWLFLKNTMGVILLVFGGVMIITPGPGLIGILLGISLIDLPGRQKFLNRGLRLNSVRRSLNWIRRRFGRAPLQFPRRQPRKIAKQ